MSKELGEFLKHKRKLMGLSFKDMEEQSFIPTRYFSSIEKGDIQTFTLPLFKQVTKAYGVPMLTVLNYLGLLDDEGDEFFLNVAHLSHYRDRVTELSTKKIELVAVGNTLLHVQNEIAHLEATITQCEEKMATHRESGVLGAPYEQQYKRKVAHVHKLNRQLKRLEVLTENERIQAELTDLLRKSTHVRQQIIRQVEDTYKQINRMVTEREQVHTHTSLLQGVQEVG